MSELEFEEQLKKDLGKIVEAMIKKPDSDEVECIACGGKTTYGRYKLFNRIACESGRTIGKIEERQLIKRRITEKIRQYNDYDEKRADLVVTVLKELLAELGG